MNRIARALLIAVPLVVAGCGQSTPDSAASNADTVQLPSIPKAQQPSMAVAARFATGFDTGNLMSTRRVFVFFDPQCPHCGMFWNETKTLAKDARFTWVPVSLMSRASMTQGGAILGAQSPVAAMDEHEKKLLVGQGGMTAPNVDPRFKDVIERNTRLLESFGAKGVPYVLSVNTDTGKVFAESRGMPAAELASQLGWAPMAGRSAP